MHQGHYIRVLGVDIVHTCWNARNLETLSLALALRALAWIPILEADARHFQAVGIAGSPRAASALGCCHLALFGASPIKLYLLSGAPTVHAHSA